MVVLLTCKYEEDPIKNEGARVLTRLYVVLFFPDTQGQLTPKSVVAFSHPSFYDCPCLIPARMEKILSKIKELEC